MYNTAVEYIKMFLFVYAPIQCVAIYKLVFAELNSLCENVKFYECTIHLLS